MSPLRRSSEPPTSSNRDRHSEQRHPEAREQLEREGGHKGDAQGRHGAGAETLGDVTDALHLRRSTAEDAQRRQALQDVEEVGAEARERLPPPSRALLRVASDQPHEQRDGRQRQHEDHRRQPVDAEHVRDRDDRNRERRDELREIATEVVVEQIHTAGQQRGRLPRRNIRPRITRCECAAHSPTAHVIDGGGRRDMTARLGQPDEERAKRERAAEHGNRDSLTCQVVTVREDAADGRRERGGAGDDAGALERRARGGHDDAAPGRRPGKEAQREPAQVSLGVGGGGFFCSSRGSSNWSRVRR